MQLEGGQTFRYGDEAGHPLPSIVAIDKATGRAFGGRNVWERRDDYLSSPQYHVVQSIKRLLSTKESWYTENGTWYPEDVASQVFKQLSKQVQARGVVGGIREALITIPVDFSVEHRRTLRKAAHKAGIEVAGFVNEPTAAVMRYIEELRHCRYAAIFDWGGGTLDISVVEIWDGRVYERATNVLAKAGDDIDLDFAAAVHAQIMDQRSETLPFTSVPPADRDLLRTQCERAKCRFSHSASELLSVPSYCGAPLTIRIERNVFENIIRPRVAQSIALLSTTVEQAGLPFEAINRLILTGGSSKLRLLHQELSRDARFASALYPASDPEWDVAHGAAVIYLRPGHEEIAEELGLLLSDGSFYELVRTGDKAGDRPRELTISLIEESNDAHIIVARRKAEGAISNPERVLMFSAPTLGFDAEGIRLEYQLTQDLSFLIKAYSHVLGKRSEVSREYGKLRFAYRLPE